MRWPPSCTRIGNLSCSRLFSLRAKRRSPGVTWQGADEDEREGRAIRAAQMPLRFERHDRCHDDGHGEQRLHLHEPRLR